MLEQESQEIYNDLSEGKFFRRGEGLEEWLYRQSGLEQGSSTS
jgi:hypothetical protein